MFDSPPLTLPVLNLLQGQLESVLLSAEHPENIEESYLLRRLGLKLQHETDNADLQRFQQHFVLYHLLYLIQQLWFKQRAACLVIGIAKVSVLPFSDTLLQADDKADYYLDWQHFYSMSADLLDAHLQQFWQYVAAKQPVNQIAHAQALDALGLNESFTLLQLKKAYRSKALQLHPDRGGDKSRFILLQQAYQQLLQLFL